MKLCKLRRNLEVGPTKPVRIFLPNIRSTLKIFTKGYKIESNVTQ